MDTKICRIVIEIRDEDATTNSSASWPAFRLSVDEKISKLERKIRVMERTFNKRMDEASDNSMPMGTAAPMIELTTSIEPVRVDVRSFIEKEYDRDKLKTGEETEAIKTQIGHERHRWHVTKPMENVEELDEVITNVARDFGDFIKDTDAFRRRRIDKIRNIERHAPTKKPFLDQWNKTSDTSNKDAEEDDDDARDHMSGTKRQYNPYRPDTQRGPDEYFSKRNKVDYKSRGGAEMRAKIPRMARHGDDVFVQ